MMKPITKDDPVTMGLGDLVEQFVSMDRAAWFWNEHDRDLTMADKCRRRADVLVAEMNRRTPRSAE
jgi:hypothetical protein